MTNKLEAFFKSYANTEDQLDFRMAHETVGEKIPVISTGSVSLDDALCCGGLPKGRLIQYYGAAGCHAKGQGILLSNGTVKKVEDIVVGDYLMGPDNTPRQVKILRRGRDKMFIITPVKGKSFVVNENHVLTLSRNNHVLNHGPSSPHYELVDVLVKDWINWSNTQKKAHKLVRGQVAYFFSGNDMDSPINTDLPMDPYMLGLLIGDGSLQRGVEITTADPEILSAFTEFTLQAKLRLVEVGVSGKSTTYRASGEKKKPNEVHAIVKQMELNVKSGEKFIPTEYKLSTRENRLAILAGLIDTDGHMNGKCFDYISKSERLSNDVAFIARSVGLAAYVSECQKSAYAGHIGTYYRVSISGDCSIVPSKLPRKKSGPRLQIKNVLRTGFTAEYCGVDDFYGFTLNGDGRYLMDDFTITHNSGKTMLTMIAIGEAQKDDPEAQQVFIDSEQTFDAAWAEKLGVDTSKIILVNGDTAVNGRKCFEMLLGIPKEDKKHILAGKSKDGLLDLIARKELNINLIILDSLGSIIPPGEDTSAIGKMNMSLLARFLTTTFRKLSLEVNKAQVPFIIINHKRDSFDIYKGDHTFSGGNTYSHFLSANVYFEAIQRKDDRIVDEKENKVGHPIKATIEKNKTGVWPRSCEFKVNFGIGIIDRHEEIANLALEYNVVTKPTTVSHEYNGQKWVGFPKFCEALKDNPALSDELLTKVNEAREFKRTAAKAEQDAKKAAVLELVEKADKKNKKAKVQNAE